MTTVVFGEKPLSIEQVNGIAKKYAKVTLNEASAFTRHISQGPKFLEGLVQAGKPIYGVTTGYGDRCTVSVPISLADELPHRTYVSHGCGCGANFDLEQTRAILAARLASLSLGYSGVRIDLLRQIAALLKHDILPRIPQEGSVGASGDLTPLSYVAAVLSGEREAWLEGKLVPANEALKKKGLSPLCLHPKEALAIMNGTAVTTGLACLAWSRAEYVSQLASRITALAVAVCQGNPYHFEETIFKLKPYKGQKEVARRIRVDLLGNKNTEITEKFNRLQDRYSLRCAPHVIGVLEDVLPFLRALIECELNSVNDNPIIDPIQKKVFYGGNFYGGHMAFAMDSLKNLLANVADLLDRQMALLVDSRYNNGLPANLSGATNERAVINHGLQALQINVSAWTAEALKHTMPASVFSRSTECHNQDKVSMSTIAARDCLRVLELTEQVMAALLITVRQGLALRAGQKTGDTLPFSEQATEFIENLKEDILFLDEDRELEALLRQLVTKIQQRYWNLYE